MENKEYGVSSKFDFGEWKHVVYGPFNNEEEAEEWLHTEECDFRERELMNKTEAIEFAGKKAVDNASKNLESYRYNKNILNM